MFSIGIAASLKCQVKTNTYFEMMRENGEHDRQYQRSMERYWRPTQLKMGTNIGWTGWGSDTSTRNIKTTSKTFQQKRINLMRYVLSFNLSHILFLFQSLVLSNVFWLLSLSLFLSLSIAVSFVVLLVFSHLCFSIPTHPFDVYLKHVVPQICQSLCPSDSLTLFRLFVPLYRKSPPVRLSLFVWVYAHIRWFLESYLWIPPSPPSPSFLSPSVCLLSNILFFSVSPSLSSRLSPSSLTLFSLLCSISSWLCWTVVSLIVSIESVPLFKYCSRLGRGFVLSTLLDFEIFFQLKHIRFWQSFIHLLSLTR